MRSVRQLEQDLFLRRNANFSDGVELCVHQVSTAWTTPCTPSGARVVSSVVFRRVSRTVTGTHAARGASLSQAIPPRTSESIQNECRYRALSFVSGHRAVGSIAQKSSVTHVCCQ